MKHFHASQNNIALTSNEERESAFCAPSSINATSGNSGARFERRSKWIQLAAAFIFVVAAAESRATPLTLDPSSVFGDFHGTMSPTSTGLTGDVVINGLGTMSLDLGLLSEHMSEKYYYGAQSLSSGLLYQPLRSIAGGPGGWFQSGVASSSFSSDTSFFHQILQSGQVLDLTMGWYIPMNWDGSTMNTAGSTWFVRWTLDGKTPTSAVPDAPIFFSEIPNSSVPDLYAGTGGLLALALLLMFVSRRFALGDFTPEAVA
ncbi:MAG: hypothetical protein JWM35_509 [Verrucomicrobia bacterium]|nr:hypothetical protein [Verrucomicrobiota bacterium]